MMKTKIINQQVVILFTRYPRPGKVKTRLIGRLGAQGAADLHRKMTEQVLHQIKPVLQTVKIQLHIYYCEGSKQEMTNWLGSGFSYHLQQGDGLGQRMANGFIQAGQQGAGRILLIGSDCPEIDADILLQGMENLRTHDLVLGPAMDGGYYLIGLNGAKTEQTTLFDDISWGTDQVLRQTITQAENAGLSFHLLPQLHDIDRPEDLVYFNHHTSS